MTSSNRVTKNLVSNLGHRVFIKGKSCLCEMWMWEDVGRWESWDIFIEGIYMKLRILKNLNLNTER